MRKGNVDLCVILPVCNEEESIIAVFSELCTVLTAIDNLERVVFLVVDDCSQDNGIAMLKKWFREQRLHDYSLTIVRLRRRHGCSMALLKGFKLAVTYSPNLTLVMDADGQDNPAFAADLIDRAADVDIVFALRGKRSESLFFRFCYFSFQLFMKLSTGSYARTNQFCVMRRPALSYVANMNYIDYLGALLNTAPFQRDTLIAARRKRLAGVSKFSFFDHATTATIIVSWQPDLIKRIHVTSILLVIILGIVTLFSANYVATIATILTIFLAQFWLTALTKTLLKRANSTPFEFNEHIDEVFADKKISA